MSFFFFWVVAMCGHYSGNCCNEKTREAYRNLTACAPQQWASSAVVWVQRCGEKEWWWEPQTLSLQPQVSVKAVSPQCLRLPWQCAGRPALLQQDEDCVFSHLVVTWSSDAQPALSSPSHLSSNWNSLLSAERGWGKAAVSVWLGAKEINGRSVGLNQSSCSQRVLVAELAWFMLHFICFMCPGGSKEMEGTFGKTKDSNCLVTHWHWSHCSCLGKPSRSGSHLAASFQVIPGKGDSFGHVSKRNTGEVQFGAAQLRGVSVFLQDVLIIRLLLPSQSRTDKSFRISEVKFTEFLDNSDSLLLFHCYLDTNRL